MQLDNDTIAAIATPIGQAGIGIIRISGPHSLDIAKNIFKPHRNLKSIQSHRLYLGYLHDPHSGEMLDEVLLSFMKAPNSFTREDIIEINFHSGYKLLSRILRIVISKGARLARPGEFTFRAFLHGRIDLTQAEAVIDLINAKSEKGLTLAFEQLKGSFRYKIDKLRQNVIEILAHSEVSIDFPEEETDIMSKNEFIRRIEDGVIRPIEELIAVQAENRYWVDGINTVIAGRVNAGKSSILNRLLNEERAIVTPIPGTTRDVIESSITVHGLPLRLMDTAGMREVKDEVERIGVQLTEQKLAEADLLLVVIDRSRPLNKDDLDLLDKARAKKTIIVLNKIDLPSRLSKQTQKDRFSDLPIIPVSALTGDGFNQLKRAIPDYVLKSDTDIISSRIIPNLRQRKAMMDACAFFRGAAINSKNDAPMEIISLDLKSGLDTLGEIIGETYNDEILDRVFSNFCLGK